ncbi:MAG: HyaD/HybD family hydrogenase maturation endopeptidase [Desulfotomaculaceae bacterium]|nr:HyaD/HybD family hydrogenase maturation endopeptidase [Desulfotomaculaceae bacterium]
MVIKDSEEEKRIVILGVGNLLLGDEGVGIHAINELKNESFSPSVKIIDGGTAGIDLLFWLEDADYVIIIDCIEANAEPGSILRLQADELLLNAPGQISSLHDISLQEMLFIAKKLGKLPPTIIYGVQPKNITLSDQLSPAVHRSLPRLLQLIRQEINKQ